MTFREAMAWVEDLHEFPADPGGFHAGRFRWLLDHTGLRRDLEGVPLAVVAGSCGKASTARFLAHVARRAGLDVVLGTKPPLQETPEGNLERYQVSGARGFRWLAPEEFVDRVRELRVAVERLGRERPDLGPPAPYELRAWILARTAAVLRPGLAVVEANIGLREDPAGALPTPAVTLLTPVGTDHGSLLRAPDGFRPDLGPRAGPFWHKAGGVHPGSPLVLGRQEAEVDRAVPTAARRAGADFAMTGAECSLDGSRGLLRLGAEAHPVELRVPGAFQLENAAQAAAAAEVLHGRGLLPGSRADLWRGVREGLAEARTPGRLEVLARNPAVLLNVASSPEKVRGMLDSLEPLFHPEGGLVVCATFLDRIHDLQGAVDTLLRWPRTRRLVVTRVLDDAVNRDVDPALAASWPGAEAVRDPVAAVARARATARAEDLVLLLGNGMAAAVAAWGGLPEEAPA